jgi:Raf kinase inhibitor-like YbhB/YbcL family protein
MQLCSSSFIDGATIPRRFTCDGEDISPPLTWTGAPAATRSFALLCNDPDAPAGTWHHWAAYDIPASLTVLAEGASANALAADFIQAINDFGRAGYGGPCPPHRHGIHHYHFCLLALSIGRLAVSAHDPSCRQVEREARKHVLAETTLIGVYQR